MPLSAPRQKRSKMCSWSACAIPGPSSVTAMYAWSFSAPTATEIVVDRPDLVGREAILEVHAKGKPLAEDIDLGVLARQTPGFTGADLANLINEAALLAARRGDDQIEMGTLEEAIERNVDTCPECRTTFNRDLHLRSFDRPRFESLLTGHGFVHDQTIFPVPNRYYLGFRTYYGIKGWRRSAPPAFLSPLCPVCGYTPNQPQVSRQPYTPPAPARPTNKVALSRT